MPALREIPLYDVPAAPASVRQATSSRRLQRRFLRAGREAVDDRDLLELLLAGRPSVDDVRCACRKHSSTLFGTAPARRSPPARTGCAPCPASPEDAIAALKTAEALGIRMARAEVPDTVRPSLGSYDKVIEYCRTLAGHREIEEFHVLYPQSEERAHRRRVPPARLRLPHPGLSPGDLRARAGASGQRGHRCPQSSQLGSEASRADIDMTRRIKDALKTIDVTLLDHVIVTPTACGELPVARTALTGRSDPLLSLSRKEPDHARTRQRRRIRSRHLHICCGQGYVAERSHRTAHAQNLQSDRNIIFCSQSESRKAISPLSSFQGRSGASPAASHSAIALAFISRSIWA